VPPPHGPFDFIPHPHDISRQATALFTSSPTRSST
jgi:hypothetical protein